MSAHDTVFERHAPRGSVVHAALADAAPSVFWLDDLPSGSPSFEPLSGHSSADLTIVGGGYCGLWTAVLAKRRNPGARVVLLEGRTVGWAASGRNGGFCESSLTHGEANGRNRWPREYEILDRLGRRNLDEFEQDVTSLGLDCEFERTGLLQVALEPHQLPWLPDEADASDDRLDAEGVRAEINSPHFLGGHWERDGCALLHPAKLAKNLARAAAESGVEIHERSPVTGLEPGRQGPVTVRTATGTVSSRQVVLATNVFPSLLKRTRLMTVPVYDYVLVTEPLTSAQRKEIGWHNRQGLSELANQFHYARMTADHRILFGGYDAIYHAGRLIREKYEDRPATYRKLASHFFTLFPQLEGIRFTHRWAGAIDTSTQFCAFHGLAGNGRIAYAAGFTGLGVSATRFAAEVMLDRLADETTERTALEMVRRKPLPFPPEPAAYVGIQLTRWALDRADHRQGSRNAFLRALDALGLGFGS
jgi:glycine/D-amino acid oxidase-like deaminating enzyme